MERARDESGERALIALLYCKIQKVKSEAIGPKTASTYSKLEQWSHKINRRHRDNECYLDNGSQNNSVTRTIGHRSDHMMIT